MKKWNTVKVSFRISMLFFYNNKLKSIKRQIRYKKSVSYDLCWKIYNPPARYIALLIKI